MTEKMTAAVLLMHQGGAMREIRDVVGVNISFQQKCIFLTYADDERGLHRPQSIYCGEEAGVYVGRIDEAARREAVNDTATRPLGREEKDAMLNGLVAKLPDAPPPPADDDRRALLERCVLVLAASALPVSAAKVLDEAISQIRRDGQQAAAIEALRAREKAREDDMRDIAEYWNGSRTDGAMHDALEHIIEVASKHLAAGGGNG